MKLNHINPTRMDEEQEPQPQDNMMENMVSGARFDKNSLNKGKYFSGVW